MGLDRLVIELALIDGGSRVARQFAQNLRAMGKEGERAFKLLDAAAKDFGAGLKGLSIANQLRKSIVEPALGAAKEVEGAFANLRVVLPDTGDIETRLKEFGKDAARVAQPTRFSQVEIIDAQTQLKRGGFSEESIVGKGGAAEAAAQLATTEGLTMGQAIGVMTTSKTMFGLGAGEYSGVADLLARTGTASSTNAGEINDALAQAPLAGQGAFGLSPEDTFAAVGVLANAGKKGGAAGTAFNAFLRTAASADAKYGVGMFENGELRPLIDVAQALREMMQGRTDQEKSLALNKMFGDEGVPFALALLNEGEGSLEDVLQQTQEARSLQERVGIVSGTYGAKEQALSGTARTTLATYATPMVEPFKALADQANGVLSAINEAGEANPGLTKGVSYGALGLTAGAAGYGVLRLMRGAGRGALGLGALRGLGGTAAGVAEGKALEEAAGVTPVFVTNWPAGGLGGGGGIGAAAGAAGGKGMLGKLGAAGMLASAGAAGWGAGSWVQDEWIKGSKVETLVQGYLAQVLLASPARFLASDELVGEAQRTRNDAVNLVLDAVNIDVTVDKDGSAEATVSAGGSTRQAWQAMGRTGKF